MAYDWKVNLSGVRLLAGRFWRDAVLSQLRQSWECLALSSWYAANVYCCSIPWPLAALFLILATSLDAKRDVTYGMLNSLASPNGVRCSPAAQICSPMLRR